jgi:hypothetical protein
MDKRAYERPTKDNVRPGDFLATEVGENIVLISIKEAKEYAVDTKEYQFNGTDSRISTCPYIFAVIKKDNGNILVGNKVDESFLEKALTII